MSERRNESMPVPPSKPSGESWAKLLPAFKPGVVATNRAGRMTGAQRRAVLSKGIRWALLGLGGGGASAFLITKIPAAWEHGGRRGQVVFLLALAVPVVTFGMITWAVKETRDAWRGRVGCASGVLKIRKRDDEYSMKVGDNRTFDVQRRLYLALKPLDGERFHIYYAAESEMILSLERIGEESTRPINTPKRG